VLQPELYSKLSQSKVITEAALRSGISKGAINAAWDAIGEVIKAWATEGHAVAIPGLGTMRLASPSLLTLDRLKASFRLCSLNRSLRPARFFGGRCEQGGQRPHHHASRDLRAQRGHQG